MKFNKRYVLSFIVLLSFCVSQAQLKQRQVKVNQVGYFPGMIKKAVIPNTSAVTFQIRDLATGDIVQTSGLTTEKYWNPSGEWVKIADFSKLNIAGNYRIEVNDHEIEPSYAFEISDQVYTKLGEDLLHAFYLARCSMPIEKKYAGMFHRPSAFPDTNILVHASAASSYLPEGSSISSPGGWMDAGDYNKYIVNSGITTFTLLHLYETFPEPFDQYSLNIPEQHNRLPDILDEALYNLRWMLTMQDKKDGGVYHKLTSLRFHSFVSPENANRQRYVVSKSTAAAYNLAAVCAKAARIFQPFEEFLPGFFDSCLVAASGALKWADEHPNVYYKNPDGVITGAYDDTVLTDEKFWAQTEMALTMNMELPGIPHEELIKEASWSDAAALALYSMAAKNKLKGELASLFLCKADSLVSYYYKSAYPVSMKKFVWGSNSVALNQGIFLYCAYLLTDDEKYLEASGATVNYVLGTNATGYCFVTGFGTHYPVNIHDRRSATDNHPGAIPGYIVGGPNIVVLKDCPPGKRSSEFPAISYIDEQCSYSTNEIAINWQAAMVFMTHALIQSYGDRN